MHRSRLFISPVILSIVSAFTPLLAQDCRSARELIEHLNKHHLEPREVNDRFAAGVFVQMLGLLDPDRIFFTAKDSLELSRSALLIDDQVNSGKCAFISALSDRYVQRVNRYASLADSLLAQKKN